MQVGVCHKNKWCLQGSSCGEGFPQLPGLDYYLQCSPVVNDIAFRIWLTCVLVLVWQLQTLVFDVETAFLHGSFCPGEEVYMNCPPGMVHQTDECLLLLKTLCGFIQAARHYFNFFSKILLEIGFTQSPAGPSLFLFKNAMGIVLVMAWQRIRFCVFASFLSPGNFQPLASRRLFLQA